MIFSLSSGMPVSGSVGQGLSMQNQPSSSYVGASGNPVQSAGNLGMQGQGSQLPGGFGMPPVPPPSASFGAGGFGGPSLQGPVFHVTMKPREPPVFCGKTSEDVETWIFHRVSVLPNSRGTRGTESGVCPHFLCRTQPESGG